MVFVALSYLGPSTVILDAAVVVDKMINIEKINVNPLLYVNIRSPSEL